MSTGGDVPLSFTLESNSSIYTHREYNHNYLTSLEFSVQMPCELRLAWLATFETETWHKSIPEGKKPSYSTKNSGRMPT